MFIFNYCYYGFIIDLLKIYIDQHTRYEVPNAVYRDHFPNQIKILIFITKYKDLKNQLTVWTLSTGQGLILRLTSFVEFLQVRTGDHHFLASLLEVAKRLLKRKRMRSSH